jgi:hypothetical protein
MRNIDCYVENQYCPHCGSNCIGSPENNMHDDYFVCDECGGVYRHDELILFWVDMRQHRPDPAFGCSRCVHRGDTIFPWVEGACKDLPFWLMAKSTSNLRPGFTFGCFKNEVDCVAYKRETS